MNIVENIRRIGIFMIAAQTVMHFAAGKQYEKYMRAITGVIILLLFIGPFTSSTDNPLNDWQAEIKRMEQQMQNSMQQEMPYAVSSAEAVAMQQIEEEIKARLNDTISDRDYRVTDVVIDLEETDSGTDTVTGDGERSLVFRRVKVTLEDADVSGDSVRNENRMIRIEEITLDSGLETDVERQEAQEPNRDVRIREYQRFFAQALGITDDRVEVIYHGGW